MGIDSWDNINKAIRFYTSIGYNYIDLPWTVDLKYINHTYDGKDGIIDGDEKNCLVGSAEQSFLSIYDDLEYDRGYVACTPCFRKEDIDYIHKPYFIKVELFEKLRSEKERKHFIAGDAISFFQTLVSVSNLSFLESGEKSMDIELNNIEIGSYSINSYEDKAWQCGTGIAEPRFSFAASK